MKHNLLSGDIRSGFLKFFKDLGHEVVPSSSLIPHNDNTLLFTNAGMVQFKNMFLGLEHPKFECATSVQKCLRAGGKHNDLDNVGYNARHHTFFEMLGNFSFGYYFKESAIKYAFDFITKYLGIPKDRLYVTVYYTDEESYKLWKKIGNFPDYKIIRIKTSDNFWSMGNVGPAGPCTEIFYDYGESVKGGLPGSDDEDGDRFTEIWNLVFMQYNQQENAERIELATPCVDTGMGLERMASVMEGKLDNYDTDVFTEIIHRTEELFKIKQTEQNRSSFKIIADHMRACSFLIADGILPSNEGRGYVLRRIMRRAIRQGFLLASHKDPIFYRLVPLIEDIMSFYKELKDHRKLIEDTIYNEEECFNRTIEGGLKLLSQGAKHSKNGLFSGKEAFKLYDTYGFPLDLTQDILNKNGLRVDISAFENCMSKQRALSKQSWAGSGEIKDNDLWFALKKEGVSASSFNGYNNLTDESNILKIIHDEQSVASTKDIQSLDRGSSDIYVIFNQTPFYPEGGGQVGDKGFIIQGLEGTNIQIPQNKNNAETEASFNKDLQLLLQLQADKELVKENYLSSAEEDKLVIHDDDDKIKEILNRICDKYPNITGIFEVLDTKEVANHLIIHKVKSLKGFLQTDSKSLLVVNSILREKATVNHTATHLMFAAICKVLGYDVSQQGSLVTPGKLRADISLNKPLTHKQIMEIEHLVNRLVTSNLKLSAEELNYQQALLNGAKCLQGKNYPEKVRVVSIEDNSHTKSIELCCGCHVANTGEIGLFKIVSESSIRSGVRRVEAITGEAALAFIQSQENQLLEICKLLKANTRNVSPKIAELLENNKSLRQQLNKLKIVEVIQNYITPNLISLDSGVNIVFASLPYNEFTGLRKSLPEIINRLKPIVLVFISTDNGKLSFCCAISKDLTQKLNLSSLMQDLKDNLEISGGGNQEYIQGSLSDSTNCETLVDKIKSYISSCFGNL